LAGELDGEIRASVHEGKSMTVAGKIGAQAKTNPQDASCQLAGIHRRLGYPFFILI
jgi:hypothetical protein